MNIIENSKDFSLHQMMDEIHENAAKKGFWSDSIDAFQVVHSSHGPTVEARDELCAAVKSAFMMKKLMLVVTELSEACEADRINKVADIKAFSDRIQEVLASMKGKSEEEKMEAYAALYKAHVKDSLGAEIAGACIRLFDFAKGYDIDLPAYIFAEHNYNLTRKLKHGKKY